ncbi:hypothetical protein GQ55_1G056400 [Panicum hallii var. hallii]|uniref:Uncharacterized protein n=1 Tax=Panicum hallii var. hallii TaxID=1504633 RepID=A0A2T7F2M6_9POAL|nr:hypothetical protein GQ55_1G056400 [Panicum hallii var. hallii]
MASSAAGNPSLPPPPPRGWLSCLVSGAGRLLAAALDPDSSASDTTTSSPESSQSPPRRALVPADDGTGTCIASDSCQLNLSGKEIVLKDSGNGSFAVVSEIDPKEAVKQLLIQDTYSRSECDELIKIIQERVVDSDPGVDEPEIVLPIAWHASTQQHPVAYSSSRNTSLQEDLEIPAYSPGFDNTVQKEWLKKSSTSIKGLGIKNHDRSQPSILQVMKRRYSSTGATFEESRRVRLKQNGSSTSGKNDKFTVGNDSCSASKLMFQEDIEAAPSASMGFHPVNSSKSYTRGFNLESSIPTKTRSPVPASRSRRPNNRQTARPSNRPPQLNNTAPAGQEPDAGRIQAKRPVGRPRRERR